MYILLVYIEYSYIYAPKITVVEYNHIKYILTPLLYRIVLLVRYYLTYLLTYIHTDAPSFWNPRFHTQARDWDLYWNLEPGLSLSLGLRYLRI